MVAAAPVVRFDIVRIHSINSEVAVGLIVATRLSVLGVPQPPRAAVRRLPRALFLDTAVHGMVLAPAAAIVSAGNIHNQMRFAGILANVLVHNVVYDDPVVLVARRPNLPATRTRIFLCAL